MCSFSKCFEKSNTFTFFPQGVQSGLHDIEILPDIILKKGEDLFKKLIEERFAIKKQKQTKELDQIQKILKIIANSTCYGKFIQINTKNTRYKKKVTVYGLDTFDAETFKIENPAEFFHPIISVFLTAGSRLILAAAECLLEQNKGNMMYCDTDSVFVSPDHTRLIQDFFRPLNPYKYDVDMFKVEDDHDGNKLHNVWFYGISAKRYVLYDNNDTIIIRKHSAHGLGHLIDVDEKQWWYDILSIHYGLKFNESKYSNRYATSQLTISNFDIYKRFAKLNHKKPLNKMIKPFNFITVGTGYRTDPVTGEPIIPMMPFIEKKKIHEAPYKEFLDYKTGKSYPNKDYLDTKEYWKPMNVEFSKYVEHNDAKSEGETGQLGRKWLEIDKNSIHYIGKESNELEQSEIFGVSKNDTMEYVNFQKKIRKIIASLTLNGALKIGLDRRELYRLKKKLKSDKLIVLRKKILETLFK